MSGPIDPLSLAEAVAAGRMTATAAEASLAAAARNDRDREAALAEFAELLVAVRGVRRHADAFREALDAEQSRAPISTAPLLSAQRIDRSAVRVRRRPERRSSRWAPAAGLLAAAVLVAAVIAIPRLLPSVASSPSPSPTLGAIVPTPSSSESPTASASSPSPSPTPSAAVPTPIPTSAGPGIPAVPNAPLPGATPVFVWAAGTDGTITIWTWSPGSEPTLVTTFPGGIPGNESSVHRSVIAAPDGRAFAIAEGDEAGHSQFRVVNADGSGGYLVKLSGDPDVAWSGDGSSVVYGVVPGGWTVVSNSGGTTWSARTFPDPAEPARVLGFSANGGSIYGFYTQAEADFWERPIRLDLTTGTYREITHFGTGGVAMARSNTNTQSDLVDPASGTSIDSGTAQGAVWETRTSPAQATPLPGTVTPGADGEPVAWGAKSAIWFDQSRDSGTGSTRKGGVVIGLIEGGAIVGDGVTAIPAGSYEAAMLGVRAETALIGVNAKASAQIPFGQRSWNELVAIDLASGETAVLVPTGELSASIHVAGWRSAP